MPISDFKLITPAQSSRPGYLVSVLEAGYGTKLTRIADAAGSPILGLAPESWDTYSRHHYSKHNPWNADGTLFQMEQPEGGSPSKMILDAATWKALKGNVGHLRASYETRWHPTDRRLMVGYNKSDRALVVFDALTDALVKRIAVPFAFQSSNGGFMGEGNPSDDFTVCALGDEKNNVFMVDIASGRVVGPQKVAFERVATTGLDNITVSPLSTNQHGYVVCHGDDFVRVFKYGPDLVLVPYFESALKLSHAVACLTPSGRECFVGGARAWYGPTSGVGAFSKDDGRIAAIFLDTGEIKNVSAGIRQTGKKESGDQHCSRGPNGWVGVTYAGPREGGGWFCDELCLIKLDGSREYVRFGVTRSDDGKGAVAGIDYYRSEAQGVWRRDGKQVVYASNWSNSFATKPWSPDVKDYVLELQGDVQIEPPPALARFYVSVGTSDGVVIDGASGRFVMLPEIVKLLNLLR